MVNYRRVASPFWVVAVLIGLLGALVPSNARSECIEATMQCVNQYQFEPIDTCSLSPIENPPPGPENPPPPEQAPPRIVKNTFAIKIYQSAIDKLLTRFPEALCANFKLSIPHLDLYQNDTLKIGLKGDGTELAIGIKESSLQLKFQDNNTLVGNFDIELDGTFNLTISIPGSSPTIPIHVAQPKMKFNFQLDIINNQLELTPASRIENFELGVFDVGHMGRLILAGINLFLPLIIPFYPIGLLNEWFIRDVLIEAIVKNIFPTTIVPKINDALKNHLQLSFAKSANDLGIPVSNNEMNNHFSTTYNLLVLGEFLKTDASGMVLTGNTAIEPQKKPPCRDITGGVDSSCDEIFEDVFNNRPQDLPFNTDIGADVAVAATSSLINQTFYSVWRGGLLTFDFETSVKELLQPVLPNVSDQSKAQISIYIEEPPTVSINNKNPSPVVDIKKAKIFIRAKTQNQKTVDINIQANLQAKLDVNIAPAYRARNANPNAGQLSVTLDDFDITQTTLESGSSSSILSPKERKDFVQTLLVPKLQQLLSGLNLVHTTFNFKLPTSNQRVGFKILKKEKINNSIIVYAKYDISYPYREEDSLKLGTNISQVSFLIDNQLMTKPVDYHSRRVVVGSNDFTVEYPHYWGADEFDEYITVLSSLDAQAYSDHGNPYSVATQLEKIPDGDHWFYLRLESLAGNTLDPLDINQNHPLKKFATANIIVDTKPPQTIYTVTPKPYLNETSVALAYKGLGQAAISDFDIVMLKDNALFSRLEHIKDTTVVLPTTYEGIYRVLVFARNEFNRMDPNGVKAEFIIDKTPPVLTAQKIQGARASYISSTRALFYLHGQDNFTPQKDISYRYKITGSPNCSFDEFSSFSKNPLIDLKNCQLQNGSHELIVQAKDLAENIQTLPAQYSFTVDNMAPEIFLTQTPHQKTNEKNLFFYVDGRDNFTPANSLIYQYRLSSDEFSQTGITIDNRISFDDLESKTYHFEVLALDLAQNQSNLLSYDFTVDAQSPVTQLLEQIPSHTSAHEITLNFSASDDRSGMDSITYLLKLDDQETKTLYAKDIPITLSDLSEGHHRVEIKAIDEFKNAEKKPILIDFTNDYTIPRINYAEKTKPKNLYTTEFIPKLVATDNLTSQSNLKYAYRVSYDKQDPSPWSEDLSIDQLTIPLNDGPSQIEIVAIDEADLRSEAIKLDVRVKKYATGCNATGEFPMFGLLLAVILLFLLRRRTYLS